MPAKEVRLPLSVQKRIGKLPKQIQKRFYEALSRLKEDPLLGIRLRGDLAGYCKLRLGDYRIVYRFRTADKVIEILAIEHRQGVYK